MTVKEAAAELGLGPDAVYDLCARGLLKHLRIGPSGGRIRILPRHVEEYLAGAEVDTPKPQPRATKPRAGRGVSGRADGEPLRHIK
jgi:excisionase family DNA binding protein